MLFSDQDFVTSADLAVIDGEVDLNIITNKAVLGLTLDGPGSIIRRTIEECGSILTAKFQTYSGFATGSGTSAHQWAVLNTGGNNAVNRPRFRLYQVVAVEPDPTKVHLRRWVEYCCLAAIFRAVFRRATAKDSDRYRDKVADYESESRKAAIALWSAGVPILPTGSLDCPGAIRQFGSGLFSASSVTAGGAGSTDPGTPAWYVAITYIGSGYLSPLVKANAESAGSAVVPVLTAAGQVITVSLAGLTPPDGTGGAVGTADGVYSASAATGWNVYAGATASALYLQNATPIPIATLSYTLLNAPVLSGYLLQSGQFSLTNYAFQNIAMRA